MKKLLKIIAVLFVFSLVSCTDNQEIVTDNEKITQEYQFSVDKGNTTTPNHDGDTGDDLHDEE